jgi:phosphoglycerate kinase
MHNLDNYNFAGKKAIVRVDFNVPLNEKNEITDDTRMVTAIPTLRKILADGGSIILLTHLGRPKGVFDPKMSLTHIIPHLTKLLDREIKFATDCIGDEPKQLAAELKPGEVLLLENLRFHKEEMEGDKEFAHQLASLGDVYVNDAFGTAHRAHASTCTIAAFFPYDKMFGFLVESEINHIDKALKQARRPFTAILGGSKVSTKIQIIEALLEKVDNLIIGGGIIYTFVKAMGGNVGDSLVEDDYLDVALKVIETAKRNNVKLYLPTDCVVADKFSDEAEIDHCDVDKIKEGWRGLDIGIKSANRFARVIENSKTILWNGPVGVFEMANFSMGTLKVAMAVAIATDRGTYSLVGGGDTIAAVNKYSLAHKISYISTAGGALLEYIEGKKLPSIRAIKETFSVDDYDFRGKRALVRVDFNVPLNEKNEITDDTRMKTAIPTLHKILADGGSVVVLTHLGRPKGVYDDKMSLKHIVPHLEKLVGRKVTFVSPCTGDEALQVCSNLKPGEVVMLENLRFNAGETAADEAFARQLAQYGDVYINNAFGTAHRAHASTYTIAKFFPNDKMLGYLVESEINHIDRALKNPQRPLTAILGGSKVSTKIHIIEALLEKVDNLIIGGGIIYTFIKAMGGNVGASLVEDDFMDVALKVIETAKKNDVKLYFPMDCIIADKYDNDANIEHCAIDNIKEGWMGLDIGIKSAEKFSRVIEESSTILWNGPMGVFEMAHFSNGTLRVAMAVARSTDMGAYSLVGGGDSIAAVNKYSLAHKISYISTAGGALLEYIEGKELPAIAAIKHPVM